MLGKLVPCGGGPPTLLQKTRVVIGRKTDCDIILACQSVSGRHCLLELIDGAWWVSDLESRNGTSVNGRRSEKQRISPNDVLGVGRQRLVVDYRLSTQASVTLPLASTLSDEDLAFDFLSSPVAEPAKSPSDLPSPTLQISKPASEAMAERPAAHQHAVDQQLATDLGRLIPCGGGAPIPLRYPALVLGRSPECDIQLRYPSISSRHCKLGFEEGYWLVEDLNSTNGTWVDGSRCLLQCLLPESVLALHKYRYTIHYLPRGNGEPPIVKQLFAQSLLEKAGLDEMISDERLAGQLFQDDSSELPKRYNLLDPDDE